MRPSRALDGEWVGAGNIEEAGEAVLPEILNPDCGHGGGTWRALLEGEASDAVPRTVLGQPE